MSGELFRTNIVTRDPRYPSIIAICNYSLAGLFLGMFLTLTGVMLTAVNYQKPVGSDSDTESKFAHIFGLTLLISGCLLILFAVATFMVASLMYLKTTTSPPETNESGEEPESVWSYLDNLPEKASTSRSGSSSAAN